MNKQLNNIQGGFFIVPETLNMQWLQDRLLSVGPLYAATLLGILSGKRTWMAVGLLGGLFINIEKGIDWLKSEFGITGGVAPPL